MNRPTEFVNFRVAAIGVTDKAQVRAAFDPESAFPAERRSLIFDGRPWDTPVHHRGSLPSGWTVDGPAVIEEPGATTILPLGSAAEVLDSGCLSIAVG